MVESVALLIEGTLPGLLWSAVLASSTRITEPSLSSDSKPTGLQHSFPKCREHKHSTSVCHVIYNIYRDVRTACGFMLLTERLTDAAMLG